MPQKLTTGPRILEELKAHSIFWDDNTKKDTPGIRGKKIEDKLENTDQNPIFISYEDLIAKVNSNPSVKCEQAREETAKICISCIQ